MLAEQAGVAAPMVLKTGIGGPDAALLVTDIPAGRTTRRARRRAHRLAARGDLDRRSARSTARGSPTATSSRTGSLVDDAGDGRASSISARPTSTPDDYWRNRDVAALLATTALLVGNDRAVPAAVAAVGERERSRQPIPLVQPAALPKAIGRGREAPRQDAEAAAHRRRGRGRRRGRPSAQGEAAEPGEHRDARRRPARARRSRSRASRTSTGRRCRRSSRTRPGAGPCSRSSSTRSCRPSWGTALDGLRQHRPPVRPDRADPARVHVPEPHHPERDRRHRAPARLPAQAGRAGRVRRRARWC